MDLGEDLNVAVIRLRKFGIFRNIKDLGATRILE